MKAKAIGMAAVLFAVSGLAAGVEYPYQVVDLGPNLSPWAVNDKGEVAGGGYMGYGQAFRWTAADGMKLLGTLGGQHSWAYDISNSGMVVGQSHVTIYQSAAFKWTETDGMQQLQLLGNYSDAWAVNESGEIAGIHAQAGNALACYWDATGIAYSAGGVGLAQQQSFRGINESGVAAGFGRSDSDGHHHAFTWTMAGGIRDLGVLAGEETHVKDISDSGMIVGYSNPGATAYAWSESGGLQVLSPLSGDVSVAEGVNSKDQVVGFYGTGPHYRAFLWTQDKGMIDISPPGWTDTFAYDINKWGWIVGEGIAPDGQQHGFLLIPEPATISLLALGGMGLLKRCRRRG